MELNNVFPSDNPEVNADILMCQLNLIIECIAPEKMILLSQYHAPYINNQLRTDIKERQRLYKKAISTKSDEDWRIYRNIKNSI